MEVSLGLLASIVLAGVFIGLGIAVKYPSLGKFLIDGKSLGTT